MQQYWKHYTKKVAMKKESWYDLDKEERKKLFDGLTRRSVANSSNRGKKELEHHSGRKPIIYRVAELKDKGAALSVIEVYPVTYDINEPKAAEHYVSISI
ncbi:hypothetical protein ACLB2K_025002 [Fragaria x ananassa]